MPDTFDILCRSAGSVGASPQAHLAALVLRDAQARGLLVVPDPAPTVPARPSVIEPLGTDELSRYAVANAIGSC